MLDHLIRGIIRKNDIKIEKVPTQDNVVDPLTNSLTRHKHDGHVNSIGIDVSVIGPSLNGIIVM